MSDHDHNHDGHDHGHAHEHDDVHEPESHTYGDDPVGPSDTSDAPETAAPQGPVQGAAEAAVVQSLSDTALNNALRTSFRFLKYAMMVMAVGYLGSGVFFASQNEVKFKVRFGRVVPSGDGELAITSKSGPQICWPWEEVVTVQTEQKQMSLLTEFW
ncbi:MAG: hypothetical protein GY700_01230, partial [Propionibacteriaceae bacterium]|nr:hypothetical protein [Propionibacteriaceae bacterium]